MWLKVKDKGNYLVNMILGTWSTFEKIGKLITSRKHTKTQKKKQATLQYYLSEYMLEFSDGLKC